MHATLEILEELATLSQINSLSVVVMFLFGDCLIFLARFPRDFLQQVDIAVWMLQSLEALTMVEPEDVSALIFVLLGDPLRLVGEGIVESLANGL